MDFHVLFARDLGTFAAAALQRHARTVCWAWLIVLLLICLRVGISPQRQSVYSADYAPAGWHWLHGQEIYSRQRHFVYSPLVAAAFVPLAVLPQGVGNILWRLGCAAALLGVATLWLRSSVSGLGDAIVPQVGTTATMIGLLLLLPLAVGNINLGQINLLVLVLCASGTLAVRMRRWNLAALLLAAAGFIKIYPLAIGLLLALLYPRHLSWRLFLAVLTLFLVSFGLQRPSYVWSEYHQWFAVLGRDDRLDVDLSSSWRDFGFLLRASGMPLSDHAYRVLEVIGGLALALFLWLGRRRWAWREDCLLNGVFALGCAWMMLFGPATEQATYVVLALPVCSMLVKTYARSQISDPRLVNALGVIFMLSYILLLSSEVANAWFHRSVHHLYVRALQPIACLIFTGGIFWCITRQPQSDMDRLAGKRVATARI